MVKFRKENMRKITFALLVIFICTFIMIGCTSNSSTSTNTSAATSSNAATSTPSSSTDTSANTSTATSASSSSTTDGKTLLESRCTSCHTLAQVANKTGSASQWQRVVDDMIQRGAVLNSDEEKVLVQYLADNYK
jgi:cytochrome c5